MNKAVLIIIIIALFMVAIISIGVSYMTLTNIFDKRVDGGTHISIYKFTHNEHQYITTVAKYESAQTIHADWCECLQ
jgi:hypothetical protein